uniref:RNA binding motif protein 34 n=1 Tax=Petromyzon marinus TaxID=7757 RepID=S4R990_PETMA
MKALWSKAQEEKSKEKEERNRLKHKPSDDKDASKLFTRENALDNADKAEEHKEETSRSRREEKKRKHIEDVGNKEGEPKPAENKSGWSERPPKKAKSDAVTAEDEEKRKRTVFVGNLPMSLAKEAVKKFFRPCGVIESVRLRCIARADPEMSLKQAAIQGKTHPQRNNKNAYVVFKEEQGAVQALSRNGEEIQSGFHIRVDAASGEKNHDHKRSVFIGNLPYDVEEDRIRSHFEPCGPVESVRVVRDRESGMGKGFGYILFKGTDAVLLALHLDGSEMAGRKVRVKRSVKKEKIKPGRAGRPANSSRPGNSGRPGNAGKAGNAGRPGNSRRPGDSPKGPRNFMGEMAEKPVKKPKVRSKPGQSKVNKKAHVGHL